MNDFTVILFGVTGDLSRRKLLPALYHLIARKELKQFLIVGASLGATDSKALLSIVKKDMGTVDEAVWKQLEDRFFCEALQFTNESDFKKLNA
ncbi:MAG TPA: hypothetical protein VI521_02055, partial [Candidatus Babeliales bacterium]|nr:hypothetical protein [Candidatus Babeliales bacterium]